MYSAQAWAAHYGLPLNVPEDFVQGYADGMRLDAKGQGKPCGRGFIAPGKKCSAKGRQQLASDLKAGDAKAKARVATGKRNAQNQQKTRKLAKQASQPEQSAETKISKALKEGYAKAGGLGRQQGSRLRKNQFSDKTNVALKGGRATYKGGSSPSNRVRWGNR